MTRRSVADSVRTVLDLKRGAKPRIDCDLIPSELQAIGLITVQWAHLEHCLLFRSAEIATTLGSAPPDDIRSLSFTRRLQGFRWLASSLEEDEAKKWVQVADRIANAEGRRHKITHGLWVWENSKDGELVAISSLRPPHEFDTHIDAQQLDRLAKEISELLFDLTYPGGLAEALLSARPIAPRSKKQKSALNEPSEGTKWE